MSKKILYGENARNELAVGINAVGNAVRTTIGPKGRNVIFDRGYGGPTITNDGVSIAREIVMEDPIQNMGANVIKESAQKTNDSAGDGTTTSVILTQAIFTAGLARLSDEVNAVGIKNGLEKAVKVAVKELKALAKPIANDDETLSVATISAESEEIGKVITDTIKKLGKDSVITVEESPTGGVTSEVTTGMEFDRGFLSHYMMTNVEREEAEYLNVPIFVTDMKIGLVAEIVPLLEKLVQSGRKELVIIAEDVVGDALTTFVMNKMRGGISVLAVKIPGFGERKKDYVRDIAIVTGATLISSDTGMTLEKASLEHLGSADRVTSTKDKTIIVGGKGDSKLIKERIVAAQAEVEKIESKHDKLKVEERIAKLSGGVGVIKVGAATETASKYLKLKVEDAVNAVKAALEEGVVPGGGVALVRVAQKLKEYVVANDPDETIGFQILTEAITAPLRYIAHNGGKDGTEVVDKVMAMSGNGGYNALTDEYLDDMVASGIVDPVKVTRCAIENAVSCAGVLLTTEVAMAEIPKALPEPR